MLIDDGRSRESLFQTIEDMQKMIDGFKAIIAAGNREELQKYGGHPAPCARFCEAVAFRATIRGLEAEVNRLSRYQRLSKLSRDEVSQMKAAAHAELVRRDKARFL